MVTYELPQELIAQIPCQPRDAARLLVLDRASGAISHRIFRELPQFLHSGDCLVLNDTRVIPARLLGRRADTGGKVELLILRQACPEQAVHPSTSSGRTAGRRAQDERGWVYRCLGRPGRGLKLSQKILFDHGSLQAEVIAADGAERLVKFNKSLDPEILTQLGEIPLPPYIRRPIEPQDAQWYQTVFARDPGAVAAPTAGLHFTQELLERIRRMGVQVAFVTLHVGWGTFKPVGEEELTVGKLHSERFSVPEETAKAINETKKQGGRVIAVGTTVVRTLETWAMGAAGRPALGPSARCGSSHAEHPRVTPGCLQGVTDLFIRPPFEFKMVDALITNFHLPGTSLLHLVAAFAGEQQVLQAYQKAMERRYRFYSYGDAMLIL